MRRNLAYPLFLAFALITAMGALSACNTMAGAGKDIQNGGKDLTHSADKNGASQ
jgi:predicted small secreted protein